MDSGPASPPQPAAQGLSNDPANMNLLNTIPQPAVSRSEVGTDTTMDSGGARLHGRSPYTAAMAVAVGAAAFVLVH